MKSGKTSTFQSSANIFHGLNVPGFTTPTAFQSEIIPLIWDGKDVIGVAEPGTQKTAAYIIPILARLAKGLQGSTRALILSPTNEAAERIGETAIQIGKNSGLKSAVIFGKSASSKQQKELRQGIDIAIGNPNYVLESLWKGLLNLSALEIIVIDEIDQMSRQGLLPDIFNILMCITKKRQTLLFSAKLPENIRRLARQFSQDPITVSAEPGGMNKPAVKKTDKEKAPEQIPVTPPKRGTNTAVLREMLGDKKNDAILVFTRTKESALHATKKIAEAGYGVGLVHGRLPQTKQAAIPKILSAGPVIILVISDNASLGLDTATIFKAVNDKESKDRDGKTEHSGRSGRVDNNGKAYTLVTNADEMILHALEKYLDAPLERLTV